MHCCLLNIYGDQREDVGILRCWVVCFSIGNHDEKDQLCSRQLRTAVTPQNEKWLDQLICVNQSIVTRELRMELSISFSALEAKVVMLEYCEVCTEIERQPYSSNFLGNLCYTNRLTSAFVGFGLFSSVFPLFSCHILWHGDITGNTILLSYSRKWIKTT